MSQDKDFRKLIESQDEEQKELLWNKIQVRMSAEEDKVNTENDGGVLILSKSKDFINRKIILITSICLLIVAGLILGLCLGLNRNGLDDVIDDSPNENRYCVVGEYYSVNTVISIKQYALENNKDLLYFDIYDEIEYYDDIQYKLNDTNEVICLYEELYDTNFAFINVFITDNRTDLDAVQAVSEGCIQTTEINSVKVDWGAEFSFGYAKFEYNGYRYYLCVEYEQAEDYVLHLVQELLNK